MKTKFRYIFFFFYIFFSISIFFFFFFFLFQPYWLDILTDWSFWILVILFLISIDEFYKFSKIGKRSELSDLIALLFFGFLIFFITKDLLTSLMGAFSIYLWVGIFELKDYPIINKLLIISLITYNVIFIAGLFSFYLEDPIFINTAFSFSFWIILGLGFVLFGRKYIVVWRFMSPSYLTLFLYIIAWLAVVFVNQYTPLDFMGYIYYVLIAVNIFIYFISGFILDKMLGIKRVEDKKILDIVEKVKKDIGIKGNVKVGFGKYPILNAMAYGPIFDKRIAIIAEDFNQIPEDELKGIVAHELAHTKGYHTLILTLITVGDLFLRMIFGFPATYYDYTFADPPPEIPMIVFIFINLALYLFIYIFVRILEGKADLMAKRAGYAEELVKALYNLESFYASGREIGLNTMLLCEEKITLNNRLLDYIETAEYLHKSMIKPSRASLLANFMNSHPPTYFRIIAILGEDLKPVKEAFLPFICLKRSKQKKYAKIFEEARNNFKNIATVKFKELFQIKNVSILLEELNKKESYKLDLEKQFIFKNQITDEYFIGRLDNVVFLDDIADSNQFIVTNLENKQEVILKPPQYAKSLIQLNEKYFFDKEIPLKLTNFNFSSDRRNGTLIFLDKNNKKIYKPIKKTKLPLSERIITKLRDRNVFLKVKGELKIFNCHDVKPADNFNDYEIVLKNINSTENNKTIKFKLSELIIRPHKIFLSISKSNEFRKSEVQIIEWLISKKIQSYIFSKKPVNNLVIGTIQEIKIDGKKHTRNANADDSFNQNYMVVMDIFGEVKKLSYNRLESISFEYDSVLIQKKSETSFFSRLGYKTIKKLYPDKILYLNKA